MAEIELSAYLGVFLDEVEEQLQILDTEILQLEKDANNIETIQNIFRAAHTLKGSSAAMGFDKMKEATHHLENIFEQIRQRKLAVTPELITVIFNSIDLIKQLKEAIIEGTLDLIDITPFIVQLEQFSDTKKSVEIKQEEWNVKSIARLDDYQKNVLLNGLALDYIALEVHIEMLEDAQMKSVRALLIQNNLMEYGEIISSFPDTEEIEKDENFNGQVVFTLLTKETKKMITEQINRISDVKQVKIRMFTEKEIEQTEQINEQVEVERTTVPNKLETTQVKSITTKNKIASTVRVDVDKLEQLMNLVGELVIDRTRLEDVRGRFFDSKGNFETEYELLDEVTNHISRVAAELQEGMMKTRMLPIEQLFNRFPRMVRDTAIKANKSIEFIMHGKETELDRTLIEEISDPIIHLLRNSIDHGIEHEEERVKQRKPIQGKIILSASYEENHVVISISDDGRGIDAEKIKQASIEKGMLSLEEANKLTEKEAMFLIFQSGVSTAKKITDISGRGVGMDIVKAHIEKLNGIIDIESTVGKGTTFTIKLPLTLAIIRSLLVKFGEKTFAIPLVNVLEIIRLNTNEIQMVKEQEVGVIRGKVLPLVRMKEQLGIADIEESKEIKKREFVIVVGIADKRIGIIADKTIGNQEIVIKSLGSYIGSPKYISGATIMGDGNVALILDVGLVVREYGTQILEQSTEKVEKSVDVEQQLVTFKIDEVEYGIEIQRAKDIISVPTITKVVESTEDLLGIINLRGTMLPVIDLRRRFGLLPSVYTKKSRIIIVENGTKDVGFLVDEVTQVLKVNDLSIELPKEEHQYNTSKLIKGITKLEDRVVLILEFDKILNSIPLVNIENEK